MKDEIISLRAIAEYAKYELRLGKITREEAKLRILPFLEAVNKKSKELAKKHGVPSRSVSFASFIR